MVVLYFLSIFKCFHCSLVVKGCRVKKLTNCQKLQCHISNFGYDIWYRLQLLESHGGPCARSVAREPSFFSIVSQTRSVSTMPGCKNKSSCVANVVLLQRMWVYLFQGQVGYGVSKLGLQNQRDSIYSFINENAKRFFFRIFI